APSVGPSVRERVEREADSSGWSWRTAGVSIRIGYHPQRCCHWGVYDHRDRTVWIGPGAFATDGRVRYVALHELAHAWQFTSGHLQRLVDDVQTPGPSRAPAIEKQADCVAAIWGAGPGHCGK